MGMHDPFELSREQRLAQRITTAADVIAQGVDALFSEITLVTMILGRTDDLDTDAMPEEFDTAEGMAKLLELIQDSEGTLDRIMEMGAILRGVIRD